MHQNQVSIKTPEFVSLKFNLAGLGSRAGAMIIDQLLLLAVNIGIVLFLLFGMNVTMHFGDPSIILALAIIFLFVLRWGYFFVSEYFFGGKTVGKKAIGIRVIQENGHSITLLSSFIRNLLRIIDMLPTGYFIGIIMVFFHSKHKRLGDLVAGTIVVHERETKRKENPINQEMRARGLTKESIPVDDLTIRSLEIKEWKLLKTYSDRFLQLPVTESTQLTKRVAMILLPKVNLPVENKTNRQLEDALLALYLIMREEWEYEL